MRRSDRLDPTVARELEALDAALAGAREDPDVALIAAEARAAAPELSPEFSDRLEAAARRGFAPAGRQTRRRPRLRPALLAPALAAAAAVLLALVVAVPALDGSGAGDESATPDASPASAPPGGGGQAQDSAASSAPPGTGAAGAGAARRVRQAADLTITTPRARLEETGDAVNRVVDRLDGYVERSQVAAGEGSAQATFDLRIPAARLDEGLAALSRLGHVRSRSRESEDITSTFASARSRLADARAEREALLRALAGATTELQIESLQRRLAMTRGRIAAARADLQRARRAAGFARVAVTLLGVGKDDGATAGGDDRWTPGRALEDALDVLSVAAGVLIVAVASLLPLVALALVGALAARLIRRRRREGTLDPEAGAV